MGILNAATPICTAVTKNCFRCGRDFQDFSDSGQARVCAECKKPKAKPLKGEDRRLLGQPLTPRQVQVTNLIAKGKLNKEIGLDLHLGEGTIKVIVSIILAKTGMANRTCLAVWWLLQTNETLMAAAAAGMGPA
jgi:DNA-binding NarL/FixJ family response regulator